MKKYKVLEAHQGDRAYMPGDPETGTRIADENAVRHLVNLGLLEEIGDVDEPDLAADDGDEVSGLRIKVEALTNELADMRADRDRASDAAAGLQQQVQTLTQERDDAAKGFQEQMDVLTGERDEARAELAKKADAPAAGKAAAAAKKAAN